MKSFCCCLLLAMMGTVVSARDAGRDLRRMVGYVIIDAAMVSEVKSGERGEKYLVLSNGKTYRVDDLYLDPLYGDDVIVFARKIGLPDAKGEMLLVKLLVDNEVHDVAPIRLPAK